MSLSTRFASPSLLAVLVALVCPIGCSVPGSGSGRTADLVTDTSSLGRAERGLLSSEDGLQETVDPPGATVGSLLATDLGNPLSAEGSAADLAPHARLFELSALSVRVRQLPDLGSAMLRDHWSSIPDYHRGSVRSRFETAFDPDALLQTSRSLIARRFDPRFGPEAIRWLETPAGFAVKFAEATADQLGAGSTGSLAAAAAARDDHGLLSSARLAKVTEFARAADAIDAFTHRMFSMGEAIGGVLVVTTPGDSLAAREAAIRRELEAEKLHALADEDMRAAALASLAYRYREVSDEDFDSYVRFAQTPAGRWYHELIDAVVVETTLGAGRELADGLRRDLKDRGPTSGHSSSLRVAGGRTVQPLFAGRRPSDDRTGEAMVFRYQTELDLEATRQIRSEVYDVWRLVSGSVVNGELDTVIMSVATPVTGVVFTTRRSREFVFLRDELGEWSLDRELKPGALSPSDRGAAER